MTLIVKNTEGVKKDEEFLFFFNYSEKKLMFTYQKLTNQANTIKQRFDKI
jgi:hypothetical protein